MFKFARKYEFYRRLVGILYCLLFAGFAIVPGGVRTAHWLERNAGLKVMLACGVAYIAFMSFLVWLINKTNEAYPTLTLPPASILQPPPIEESDSATDVTVETTLKSAGLEK
ncbi:MULTISPECIES: hypothetical protein [Mesorhizobium]|uniref:DUF485 domain-containing protein n=1 Tax=Mesorhizobium shonense TaxID=1209948 RepID=A0ABV2HXI8_9HYPH|nr:hypothetical protein [Mesorhizobium sp.]RWB21723.1 MAG: hypothetical protein EOQ40_09390 [Mesorhizobium sp.]RWD99775.1 MAG: hypothetical protein EOS40_18565 [Mesorhizobium sp.]TIS51925.1 MAG: hypothetical protein E5W96_01150 [Mesorhizobium sp.]TIT95670.1 MAG: hypothetical protein E5W55_12445 [Mesorhizobium sp.]